MGDYLPEHGQSDDSFEEKWKAGKFGFFVAVIQIGIVVLLAWGGYEARPDGPIMHYYYPPQKQKPAKTKPATKPKSSTAGQSLSWQPVQIQYPPFQGESQALEPPRGPP